MRKPTPSKLTSLQNIERALSLADAFIARNNIGRALEVLEHAQKDLGPILEIENKINELKLLASTKNSSLKLSPRRDIATQEKRKILEDLLSQIQLRKRLVDPSLK